MQIKGTEIVVRKKRGKLVVQLINRTPRGQKYIKKEVALNEEKIADKNFKQDLAAKILELGDSGSPTS